MKVTIDMYSGLPNPEIELTEEETNALTRLVLSVIRDGAEKKQGTFVTEINCNKLGYRGFSYCWGGEIMAYFYTYQGLYFRTGKDKEHLDKEYLYVPDWGVEKYLKAIALEHGYDLDYKPP